jgi:gentisate 1,2-dioxygenase
MFFEPFPDERQMTSKTAGDSLRRYGTGGLKPAWTAPPDLVPPLVHYQWDQTYAALKQLAAVDASPFDDVALEYSNPATGAHVLRTIACWIQMLRPGIHTQAHRQTSSAVYHVFAGQGSSVIGGVRYDWRQGDFFAVPPWTWHEHVNAGRDEAILFSIQDTPVFETLGLYREEAYTEHAGHQPVTRVWQE